MNGHIEVSGDVNSEPTQLPSANICFKHGKDLAPNLYSRGTLSIAYNSLLTASTNSLEKDILSIAVCYPFVFHTLTVSHCLHSNSDIGNCQSSSGHDSCPKIIVHDLCLRKPAMSPASLCMNRGVYVGPPSLTFEGNTDALAFLHQTRIAMGILTPEFAGPMLLYVFLFVFTWDGDGHMSLLRRTFWFLLASIQLPAMAMCFIIYVLAVQQEFYSEKDSNWDNWTREWANSLSLSMVRLCIIGLALLCDECSYVGIAREAAYYNPVGSACVPCNTGHTMRHRLRLVLLAEVYLHTEPQAFQKIRFSHHEAIPLAERGNAGPEEPKAKGRPSHPCKRCRASQL